MQLIYDDHTAKWVPFATAAIIVVVAWGGAVWDTLSFQPATNIALVLAALLLIGICLQGWLYWKGQVETLSFDGTEAVARTMRWVGWGPKVRFSPAEAMGWRAVPKHSDTTQLASVEFSVRGTALSLSFLKPQRVEFAALSRLNPVFFGKLAAEFPAILTVAG